MHTLAVAVILSLPLKYIMCALFENYAGHHKKLSNIKIGLFCLTHRKCDLRPTKALYTMGHMSYYQKATSEEISDKQCAE